MLEFDKIKNILVIRKHNQIGDVLVSTPSFYALKRTFRNSKITLLASRTNYSIPFKEINPYIDEILILDKSSFLKQLKIIRNIRRGKFDLVIVPSTIRFSTTSNIIAFLSGAQFRVSIKSKDAEKNKLSFLFNLKNHFHWRKNKTHQIFRNLEVIEQLGIKLSVSETLNSFPPIDLNEMIQIQRFIKSKFGESRILVGIHPGAGQTRNIWSTDNFIWLINELYKTYRANFLITGGSIDSEIIELIESQLNNLKIPFITMVDYPVKKLIAAINLCDLFVSNDTGVMHLAGLTETFLIALQLHENYYEWRPLQRNKFGILAHGNDINLIKREEVFEMCKKLIEIKEYKRILT